MKKTECPESIIEHGRVLLDLRVSSLGDDLALSFHSIDDGCEGFSGLASSICALIDRGNPDGFSLLAGLVSVVESVKNEFPDVARCVRSAIIESKKAGI